MKYAIKYSTDKRLFRQAQTNTDRWRPSQTETELREPIVICAGQNLKPKYDITRTILRKGKS